VIAEHRPYTDPTDKVDLPEQQHEHDPDGDDPDVGNLGRQVGEVSGAQEERIEEVEDEPDDDKACDDRQRADVTLAEPAPERREVAG